MLLYFVFSYSAIQPQVCLINSVQFSSYAQQCNSVTCRHQWNHSKLPASDNISPSLALRPNVLALACLILTLNILALALLTSLPIYSYFSNNPNKQQLSGKPQSTFELYKHFRETELLEITQDENLVNLPHSDLVSEKHKQRMQQLHSCCWQSTSCSPRSLMTS